MLERNHGALARVGAHPKAHPLFERARHPRTHFALPDARRGERALSLIEILVVLVIIAVLMAITIPMFRSARHASQLKGAVSAAQSYKQGVSAFMLDHGNRVPRVGNVVAGVPDWSTDVSRGPLDRYGRPYIKAGAPESVQDGLVTFAAGATPANNATNSNRYAVTYETSGTAAYTIRAHYRTSPSAAWQVKCTLGNSGAEAC